MPNPPRAPSEPDDRVRFLRACDRCRSRKVKCGNENPCKRCVVSRAVCSFSAAGGSQRALLSNESTSEHAQKRRKIGPERRYWLGPEKTAHFFLSRHGYPHHAGTTSGLPLLDATRRQLAENTLERNARPSQPDWDQLQDILGSGTAPTGDDSDDDLEYFPGCPAGPEGSADELISSISMTIPVDVMSDLLRIFFQVVHPVWPIVHIPTFLKGMGKWDDHAFAALAVSMCMLASRYSSDPRVRSDANIPTSSGAHYYELYNVLRHAADGGYGVRGANVVYAVQSLFFASLFHCVDNVPHPAAHGLFAAAFSRVLDAGLHRPGPPGVGDSIVRECRSRTAWAVYILDKQLSVLVGRPMIFHVWEIDAHLPEPFEGASSSEVADNDAAHVSTFRQLALVSACLEGTLRAMSHEPRWVGEGAEILHETAGNSRPMLDDSLQLAGALKTLDKWRRAAPPEFGSPRYKDRLGLISYSVATEQVAAVDQMVQLLVAARYLQLETTSGSPDPGKLENHRSALLHNAKETVSLIVQLGSAGLLAQCDILIAYRLLFTGRFLLASVLSARADKHAAQAEEGIRILHVTSVALRHFVSLFPVALGAAEVLDETIRVCRVPLPSKRQASRYAWYRPISPASTSTTSPATQPNTSTGSAGPAEEVYVGSAPEVGLDLGNFGSEYGNDFLWLLPGSDNVPPVELDEAFLDSTVFDGSPSERETFISPDQSNGV
ncbi:hypothetical protein CspeluHIS016_0114070 [Cutaneotrichosporon spelunceum]|uniref:Zn(2)-C6 fungal-type domain-containing protein n=1 Tax=Cutaneotrichosporon spelunceum TaxID=1672016 RepID=A0AAD3TPV8_9TREE|nr:hypothetical protein CspeluHIS016_0114070 [Cutaneotrichosporon spelunceum]